VLFALERTRDDGGTRTRPAVTVQQLRPAYHGPGRIIDALRDRHARAFAVAQADLDRDGAPDLIAGYGWDGAGIISVQRGNADAFAPKRASVLRQIQRGFDPEPGSRDAQAVRVPEPVSYLEAGDFNGDGRADVVAAARGGGMYLLAGDGKGHVGEAHRVRLPGPVTTLAAGQFRAADDHLDVAVGVMTRRGAELLIYDGASAGPPFARALRLPLPGDATAIRFGSLDTDPYVDIAVAAGGRVEIIHGWGHRAPSDLRARVERLGRVAGVHAISIGHFIRDRAGRNDIAAAFGSGAVKLLMPDAIDTRPLTSKLIQLRAASRVKALRAPRRLDVDRAPAWRPSKTTGWHVGRRIGRATPGALPQNLLTTAKVSLLDTDDLLIANAARGLDVVRADRSRTAAQRELSDAVDDATAVMPMQQQASGSRTVVVLSRETAAPAVVALAGPSIAVDRTDDPSGVNLAAVSACTGAGSDCSLRGAVQFANANPGTTINLPSGTYVLATNGNGGCLGSGESNAIGDLELNQSTDIVGAGAASTIIRQTGTGDRVMCLNATFLVGLEYTFSGVTITGGRETHNVGGGGIIGGELSNKLTLNQVTVSNNQSSTSGLGGGGIQITGGDLTITNSLIGGPNAPGADRTDTTLSNSATTSGAGVSYTPSSPMHMGGTGLFTVTGSTFDHNVSINGASGGGGTDVYTLAFASPGGIGSGSADISTSTFSNNEANFSGGGAIAVESLATTVATTSFTSNSALNRGGAISVGSTLTLNGTTPGITMSGNSAPLGSAISTGGGGSVTVNGTNVALGGDVQIDVNGTWTNSAGSAIGPTNLTIAGGTFNANDSTTTVGGNLTFSSGTFNSGTGVFNFNGSGAQSINGAASPTFNTLQVNKTGGSTLTLNVNAPVKSNLTVGSGTFDLGAFTANRTAPGGTLTISNGAALKIGGTNGMPTNYSTYALGATSTVEYTGSGSQTVTAVNYGHLTSSSTGARTLASSGTVGVAGTFTPGTNAYTVAGSTVDFNGSGAQTIPAFGYDNLTSSSTGARTLASSGTIGVAGTFTPGTNAYTVAGSTVDFNGAGAQTIPAFGYDNLTSSSTGARTLASSGTVGVAGAFTPGTNAYTVADSTVSFNGSGSQTIPAFTFENLTDANTAATVSLGGPVTVGGALTVDSNAVLDTTTFLLTVNGTYANNGQIRHSADDVLDTTSGPFAFSDGTGVETARLSDLSGTFGSTTVNSAAGGADPYAACAGLPDNVVQRFWQATPSGSGSGVVRFTFRDDEVSGGLTTDQLAIYRCINGGSWTEVGSSYTRPAPAGPAAGYSSVEATGVPFISAGATYIVAQGKPDLTLVKTNNMSGATTVGSAWTWTLHVANGGTGDAAFTDGQTILADNLPSTGIAYGSPSVANVASGVTGGGEISCSIAADDLSCVANGGAVTLGTSDASFDVVFTATPSNAGTFANPRGGGSCAVDPDDDNAESAEGNNACSDSVTVSKADTTTTITSDQPDPSAGGAAVTVQFTVDGPGGTPTGTVEVSDGVDMCTGTVSGGSCDISLTTAGARSLTAHYLGDSNYNESTSAGESHTVDADEPDTSIDSNPSDPTTSTSASFTFSGTDAGTGVASFECQLDAGGFSACTSPQDYTDLGDGSHTFEVRAVDRAGNTDSSPASFTWAIDAPPTVTIDQAAGQPDPTNGATIHFTAVFSEPVTGFGDSDVAVAGSAGPTTAVVTEVAPNDGTTYDVAVSGMTGDGSVSASIPAGGASDTTANGNEASTSTDNTVAYDTTGPDVAIDQAATQADPANTEPIHFTAVFSEHVNGFSEIDVSLGGSADTSAATVTVTPIAGNSYDVAVSGIGSDGTVTASIPGGGVTDDATNTNNASTSTDDTVTYDTTGPGVTIDQAAAQADPTGDSTIHFTVVFSEPVSGFTGEDVALTGSAGATNAVVSEIAPNDGTTYDVTVSGLSSNGTVTATIPAGGATDAAGNGNDASTSTDNTVTYDDVSSPDVTIDQAGTQADPANAQPIHFTAVFSEHVNGFTGDDVALGGSADTTAATVDITPIAGNSYDVAVSGLGDGTVTATIPAGGAGDDAANPNNDSTSTDNTVTLDGTAPDTSIGTTPSDPSGSATASFGFSGTDAGSGVASFECKLDAESFSACTSPKTYSGLADGSHTFQVRAIDGAGNTDGTPAAFAWKIDTSSGGAGTPPQGGTPPPGGDGSVADLTAPVISALSLTNKVFVVDRRGPGERVVNAAARRHPKGTAFRYQLSEPGRVVFTISRATTGRKVGTRCVKRTKRNASRRRCTFFTRVGAFAQDAVAGANRKSFSGKLGRKTLAPGSYRATLVAKDAAGNASKPVASKFTVAAR
jgi:predicted outer membrane repeat protein